MQTFEENKKKEEPKAIDPNNQCRFCSRRAGRYSAGRSGGFVGVNLMNDSRGFKVCTVCASEGKLIKEEKLNKSEKRKFKQFKRNMKQMKNIPHVTLDAKGKPV